MIIINWLFDNLPLCVIDGYYPLFLIKKMTYLTINLCGPKKKPYLVVIKKKEK